MDTSPFAEKVWIFFGSKSSVGLTINWKVVFLMFVVYYIITNKELKQDHEENVQTINT